MRKKILILLITGISLVASVYGNVETALIVGTALGGSKDANPAPVRSKYFETEHGGIVLIRDNAGFYLQVKPRTAWRKTLYATIEYDNPLDAEKPFVNDMDLPPIKTNRLTRQAPVISFSSPGFVPGLKDQGEYQIVVRVFEGRGEKEPVDILRQKIRSHVDSTAGRVIAHKAAGVAEFREPWRLQFDERKWVVGSQGGANGGFVREYVLTDELITRWTSLVTSQHTIGVVGARIAMTSMMITLARDCPDAQLNIIEESSDAIMFEWWHQGCGGHPAQHEIRRIITTNRGTHMLAFVEKTTRLDAKRREQWIALLRAAKLK